MKFEQPISFNSTDSGGTIGGGVLGGTPNSVLFIDSNRKLAQDNPAFDYIASTHTLTIGSTSGGIAQYNTPDQTTDYERVLGQWSGNTYTLTSQAGGAGIIRDFTIGVTNRLLTFTISPSTATTSPGFGNFTTDSSGSNAIGTAFTGANWRASASGRQSMVAILPTINQTSTASYSALWISAFESAVGSGNHYLIEAGTNTAASGGGTHTSKFTVDSTGIATVRATSGGATYAFATTSRSASISLDNSTGVLTIGDANDTSGIAFGGGSSLGTWTSTGLVLVPKITKYNNIATTGWGVPAIYGYARPAAGQVGAVTLSTYTVGAADGSFLVSANILVTTATLHNFTVTCTYTDEGNTSRTLTLQLSTIAGAFVTAITNAQGTVPYEGVPLHIRAKASTAITLATTGTFTTVVYNGESSITQIA